MAWRVRTMVTDVLRLAVCLTILLPAAFAQSFEVATIRPFVIPGPGKSVILGKSGGPGTADPERIAWSGANISSLLMEAYDVKRFQISGPEWLDHEGYNIVAKVPEGATKDQVKVMWQNLLADRFGVVLHREQKELAVRELTVAKGGPKLKETDLDPNAAPLTFPMAATKPDANGFPGLQTRGFAMTISPGPTGSPIGHLTARAQSMEDFASFLATSMNLNTPVLDKTGLAGRYDFNLEYSPNAAGSGFQGDAADPGSNIASAIQQLGLRLNSGKATLDVLVIDKAEKTPTEN